LFDYASFSDKVWPKVRETERQRDRETERQRDRETERQRGRDETKSRKKFHFFSSVTSERVKFVKKKKSFGEKDFQIWGTKSRQVLIIGDKALSADLNWISNFSNSK
jgi:hypothetical protein